MERLWREGLVLMFLSWRGRLDCIENVGKWDCQGCCLMSVEVRIWCHGIYCWVGMWNVGGWRMLKSCLMKCLRRMWVLGLSIMIYWYGKVCILLLQYEVYIFWWLRLHLVGIREINKWEFQAFALSTGLENLGFSGTLFSFTKI